MLPKRNHAIAFSCLVLLNTVFANAAENVLQAIPDSALAVGYVKGVQHANEQISKVAGLVSPDAPDALEAAMSASGIREGLDKQGMMAVAVLPRNDAAPAAVMLLPTNDYPAFVKQFKPDDATARIVAATIAETPFVIGKKGSFAVLARSGDRSLVEAVLDSQQSIHAQVKPLQAFLDEGDVSFVLTERGVKSGMRQALQALRSVKTEITGAGEQAQTIAAAFGVYESMFVAIQENVSQAAVVARVDKNGTVRVASRTILRAESKLAELAKSTEKVRAEPLSGLPPGPFVFAFAGETPESWAKAMMKWSFQIWRNMGLADKMPQEKMDKLVEAGAQTMKGVRGMGMSMNVGEKGEPLYGNMYITVHTENASEYLDRYEKMTKVMAELAADGSIPFYDDLKITKIQVAGKSGLRVSMGFGMAGIPGAEKESVAAMFKKMFGGEKLQVFLAAADDTTVVGAYTSKKQLVTALRAAKAADGGLAGDRQIRSTANLLLEDARWVAYFSPAGGVEFARNAMALFAPDAPLPEFPEFPQSPPIGFGAKLSGQSIHTELVVPAATLKAMGQFANEVRKLGSERDSESLSR